MARECPVCAERQKEIDRILSAYGKDKKLYQKIIGILGGVFILYIIFGPDIIMFFLNIFKDKIQ